MLKLCWKQWYIIRYQEELTPWSRVLLGNLVVAQLDKKFPAFYQMWKFTTMFTRACHWSISWNTWIQSTLSHYFCKV